MRFKFTKDFDYRIPEKRTFIAYKAGTEDTIPQAHAEAAKKAGAGHEVETKNKHDVER